MNAFERPGGYSETPGGEPHHRARGERQAADSRRLDSRQGPYYARCPIFFSYGVIGFPYDALTKKELQALLEFVKECYLIELPG
jgi:hypothetical protein